MNEGYSALLSLELLRRSVRESRSIKFNESRYNVPF